MNCFWKLIEWCFSESPAQSPPSTKKELLRDAFPIMIHQREFHSLLHEYIKDMSITHEIKRKNSFSNLLAAWPIYEWEEAVKVKNLQNCLAHAKGRFYFTNMTGLSSSECYFALESKHKQIVCFDSKDCTQQVVLDKMLSTLYSIEMV